MRGRKLQQILLTIGVFFSISCILYVSLDNANQRRRETIRRNKVSALSLSSQRISAFAGGDG